MARVGKSSGSGLWDYGIGAPMALINPEQLAEKESLQSL